MTKRNDHCYSFSRNIISNLMFRRTKSMRVVVMVLLLIVNTNFNRDDIVLNFVVISVYTYQSIPTYFLLTIIPNKSGTFVLILSLVSLYSRP